MHMPEFVGERRAKSVLAAGVVCQPVRDRHLRVSIRIERRHPFDVLPVFGKIDGGIQ